MSNDTSPTKGYKRINFFKGFLTTEHDWNAAEAYHIEKRKLHNRLLHTPGVVVGVGNDLRVAARARGDLSVEVQSGYGIDGQGRELWLPDAVIKNISPEEYRLPQTIYVVLRFYEELTDFIAYKENLEYKGHRRVLEGAKIELSQTEPDLNREIELARIYLEKGATRIRDARNPADPRANEIDLRFVPVAGVAGSRLSPPARLRLEAVLWQLRNVFLQFARREILAAHDVLQAANTALMMHTSHLVDLRNVFDMFYILVESQGEVCLELEVKQPALSQKKEFPDYKRHVEILRGLLAEGKSSLETFTNLLAYQTKASEVAELILAGEKPVIEKQPEKKKVAELKDWDAIKTTPHPKSTIELDGITWVLVDQINILDKESEEKHDFAIKEAKDSYRSRQKLKYPDETVVEDVGRAHVSGFATYKIQNLTPGKPVVILRRMDYVYGDYELEYFVGQNSVGIATCTGTDRVHRWRNWPFMIDAKHITDSTLTVRQVAQTAGRDVNIFYIWVYQTK